MNFEEINQEHLNYTNRYLDVNGLLLRPAVSFENSGLCALF